MVNIMLVECTSPAAARNVPWILRNQVANHGVPDPFQLGPVQKLSVRIIVGLRADFQAAKPAPQDHEIVTARGVAQAS